MKGRFVIKDMGKEGAMVYDQKQDEVHFLNAVAHLIWTLSRENRTSAEIERTLRERYHSEDRRDISLDVEACLRELREKKLLSLSPSQKPGIKKRK
ncbi:MAG: PqqD family peptide modification chaperone [Candidatus Aminicenantes bacterium]|nr:PqqD family peptide modification chaperone [Candidatus Aminicenantes bacterium]